jgi:nitrite reductase/ring-hydroxylating ferredoxin subunit
MTEKTEVNLGTLDQIPEGGMQQFEVDGKSILVCRSGGETHAVEGICPHRGAQLGSGAFDGTAVTCPWHDWAFDVQSGCGVTNPMSSLAKYNVSIRDGQIIVVMPGQ